MFKAAVFLAVFLLAIPLGVVFCRIDNRLKLLCFGIMVFTTCFYYTINIAPLPDWRGTSRGFSLSLMDICSLTLLLSMVFDPRFKVRLFPPGAIFYLLYFGVTVLSGAVAIHLRQWGFEVVKMIWTYIYFLAAFNYLNNSRHLWPLFYIICGTMTYMLCIGLYQKYIVGRYFQISSTLPHQNSLALYSSLFGCVILGVLLNEEFNFRQFVFLSAGFFSSMLLLMFTLSRGGLMCFVMGAAQVGFLSLILNGFDSKHLKLFLLGLTGAAVLFGYALPRIVVRFQNAPAASRMTRVNMAKAAVRIANSHPIGVGANNFSEYSGPFRHYAVEQHAKMIITDETSQYGGIVETIYLLVAAECGWGALFVLLLWFYYYFLCSAIGAWKLRHRPCFGVMIGAMGGLFANYLQSTMEWVLKQYCNYYQLMLVFALIAAVWVNRRNIAPPLRKSKINRTTRRGSLAR